MSRLKSLLFNSLHALNLPDSFVVWLIFSKSTSLKNSFRNAIRVSNGSDPDQDQYSVGHDLGPNCLKRLSADDKFAASKERVLLTCWKGTCK